MTPGGIRLGTPALTTRGFVESDMEKIVDYLMKSIEISLRIQEIAGKQLVNFVEHVSKDEEVKLIGEEV